MSWITPLGFLGLLGIAVLILIYLLKPNFQQKVISSTHVWKLSLRYKKKRLPINKFRNILLFICQILIITSCAFILAQPVIEAEGNKEQSEKIIIIDASAGMWSTYDNVTRFERAVDGARELAEQAFADDGMVSLILAGNEATVLVERVSGDNSLELYAALDGLVDPKANPTGSACSFGAADIDGAMVYAEAILSENPAAQVLLYTGTTYYDKGKVEVIDVAARNSAGELLEWNASILNCVATINENYYSFEVDVAVYGRDTDIMLYCEINGANYDKHRTTISVPVRCNDGIPQKVTINPSDAEEAGVYSYDYVYFYLAEDDSFIRDNSFFLYGGTPETIKVLYSSDAKNNFFPGWLMALRMTVGSRWTIDITEVENGNPELVGYDFYIFEHKMPDVMPTDGVVILSDLREKDKSTTTKVPEGAGIVLQGMVGGTGSLTLAAGQTHTITRNIDPEEITVYAYQRVITSDNYTPLFYCAGDPVFLVKNEPNQKVAVLPFSINESNLSQLPEWSLMLTRMFNYFLPSTITKFVYEVNDTVSLNARGESLNVSGMGLDETLTEFPGEISLTVPGTYTLTQNKMNGDQVVESFFVKIASSECNIKKEEDVLTNPYFEPIPEPEDYDLLIYFAAALVALLAAEWWLQSREQF